MPLYPAANGGGRRCWGKETPQGRRRRPTALVRACEPAFARRSEALRIPYHQRPTPANSLGAYRPAFFLGLPDLGSNGDVVKGTAAGAEARLRAPTAEGSLWARLGPTPVVSEERSAEAFRSWRSSFSARSQKSRSCPSGLPAACQSLRARSETASWDGISDNVRIGSVSRAFAAQCSI